MWAWAACCAACSEVGRWSARSPARGEERSPAAWDGQSRRSYALIGDLQSAALVGRNGSVDWLCLPRFDSASCFTALLGDEQNGLWLLAPAGDVRSSTRRYRPGTLVLETDCETAGGAVRVIDFMPRRGGRAPQLVRIVEGLRGRVPMRLELVLRPDYGAIVP